MQTPKKIRSRSWVKDYDLTVWIEASPHNGETVRTFLVSLEEGEPPIGKIVGFESRKDGNRSIRNPSRYTQIRELWTYALTGEPASYYTKLDNQAEAIRYLIRSHENKVAQSG